MRLPENDHFILTGVLSLWFFIAICMGPVFGDFPLNDDWSYAISTFNFSTKGTFDFHDWLAIPLVGQVLYGSIFTSILGENFISLRIAGIIAGAFGIWGSFQLFVDHKIKGAGLLIALVLIAFNPIYFNLSYTFMSDIPFYAASIWCLVFILRNEKKFEWKWFVLAYIFAFIALNIRQSALIFFFVLSLFTIHRNKTASRFVRISALLIWFPPFVYVMNLPELIGEPNMQGRNAEFFQSIDKGWLHNLVQLKNIPHLLVYLGLFIFPYIVNQDKKRFNIFWFLGTIGVFMTWLLMSGKWMPLWGNILHNNGVGPIHLKDIALLNITTSNGLEIFWILTSIIGLCGAAYFIQNLRHDILSLFKQNKLISYFIIFGFTIPHLIAGMFDRYILILIPLVIILSPKFEWQQKWKWVSIVWLGSFSLFSILATHDYLSWNTAKWTIIEGLENKGVTSNQIDGGFEYNGLYEFVDKWERKEGKSYWWVKDDQYLIYFQNQEIPSNYQVIKEQAYMSFFPRENKNIYLLKRN